YLPERLPELLLAQEEANGFVHREIQYIVNVPAIHGDIQYLGLEALAATFIAGNEDVGHEDHFHGEVTRALTGFTPSAGDVEAEGARGVASLARERLRR